MVKKVLAKATAQNAWLPPGGSLVIFEFDDYHKELEDIGQDTDEDSDIGEILVRGEL